MPTYKVRHQGQIKHVEYDGSKPTKDELRLALELKPTLDYNIQEPPKPPDPNKFNPKDWIDKIDPHAREMSRPDRSMFTVDLSKATHKGVDKIAMSGDDENENKWNAQKMGFITGAGEAALNMLGEPEAVLGVAQSSMRMPSQFERAMADYPGHSINPNLRRDLVSVGGEESYNVGKVEPPKIKPRTGDEIAYENIMRNRGRSDNPWQHVLQDQTGAVGKNIRKGHITGKFIKKDMPYEPDSFDIESSKPYEPEQIDYVKQMLDSLKLADEQKKLKGLSPVKKTSGRFNKLATDETGAIGDIKGLKESKTIKFKKENFGDLLANRIDDYGALDAEELAEKFPNGLPKVNHNTGEIELHPSQAQSMIDEIDNLIDIHRDNEMMTPGETGPSPIHGLNQLKKQLRGLSPNKRR